MRVLTALVASAVASAGLLTAVPAATAAPAPQEVTKDGMTVFIERTPVNRTPVTGKGPTRSDFDGDGRDDVAASTSGQKGVFVSYSSAPGVDRLYVEIPDYYYGSYLGGALATGDFDGDGYDDLAAADYFEPDLKVRYLGAGGVWVVRGGPDGLDLTGVQHVNQSTPGVPGASVGGEQFGRALAAGDVTGDGRDDLLIGAPFKQVGSALDAGLVVFLKGGPTGLVTSGAKALTQNTPGVPGTAEKNDQFGSALAIGRINENRYADVAVGSEGEDGWDLDDGSGSVTQFWGAAAGVATNGVTAVSGIAARPQAKKKNAFLMGFGAELAIADTTGDGNGEVIVGVPSATIGRVRGGVVVSLPVRRSGLYRQGLILLSEDDASIPGTTESGDAFGASIATGDVTGDGRADVLVGARYDSPGKLRRAGAAILLLGSAKGLTGSKSQAITQATPTVPGTPEANDQFGTAVAILNLDGTKRLDAAIGAPGELVSGDEEVVEPGDEQEHASGTVTTLRGVSKGLTGGADVSGRTLGQPGWHYGSTLPNR